MVLTRKRSREQREAALPTSNSYHLPSPDTPSDTHHQVVDDHGEDGEEVEEEEEEDEEDVVLSESHVGPRDAQGRPHGEGSLSIAFQRGRRRGLNTFHGHFEHGRKSGPGEWRFDSGTSFSSRLSGTFLRDSLEGDGRYVHSDGSSTVGTYRRGVLHGEVCEYSATGALTFRGQYRDNTRNGQGTLYHTDGGVYSGDWKSGQFHGPSNVYTYPAASSNSFSLRGRWEDGRLISARLFVDDQPVVDGAEYSHDESEVGGPIALHPLLPDPYEQHCCIVQPSSLGPQAGEGLFARTDLAAGTVVSFYNGVKQWERQTERRHWDLNGNAIALDEAAGVDIDVPPPYSSLACYSATLGHKANHAFDEARQNAEYGHFLHPRFGHIKCVRVRDGRGGVKAGEELLVDYGFDKRGGPRWWREGRKRIQHGSTVAHQPVVGHAERRERGRRSRSSR